MGFNNIYELVFKNLISYTLAHTTIHITMDLATLLDNLSAKYQPRNFHYGCLYKIETHINSLNREDARSLRHALPNLLKLLLGSLDSA